MSTKVSKMHGSLLKVHKISLISSLLRAVQFVCLTYSKSKI